MEMMPYHDRLTDAALDAMRPDATEAAGGTASDGRTDDATGPGGGPVPTPGPLADHATGQPGPEPSVPLPTVGLWAEAPAADDWRAGLPTLTGTRLTLRELQPADAASLYAALTTEEVARFISPPPTSVAGFTRFIAWAHQRRAEGRFACFAVVPEGQTVAVGLFQLHLRDAAEGIAEWGFALGSAHWGTGLFPDGTRLLLRFAFATLGLRRLEAKACLANGRGTGALRKVGAVRERVLSGSFERHGEVLDQALWTILRADWMWMTLTVTGGAVQ